MNPVLLLALGRCWTYDSNQFACEGACGSDRGINTVCQGFPVAIVGAGDDPGMVGLDTVQLKEVFAVLGDHGPLLDRVKG